METNSIIKTLIVDDHKMVVDGILLMLREDENIKVVGTAYNGQECIQILEKEDVDVVLLDINMPILNGIETCQIINKRYPLIKVIALSMLSDVQMVRRMMELGASGYLLKNAGQDELINAVYKVTQGKNVFDDHILRLLIEPVKNRKAPENVGIPTLTRRQKEILKLIVEEHTTSEIASILHIGFGTVETHRRNMISKLGVRNTAGLVKAVYERKLLD